VVERLHQLTVPTLVVAGDRDGDFMANLPGFMDALPPGLASVLVLRDAGHAANLERAAEFNEAVERFAADIGYLEAPRGHRRDLALSAVGVALVALGVALLGAAFFGGGGTSLPATAEIPEIVATPTRSAPSAALPTPTVIAQVASARTPGPTAAAPSPTPAATEVPAADPDAEAEPVATPPPSSLAPTPTAAPTAVAGLIATILGPASVDFGARASFLAQPATLPNEWTLPGGAVKNNVPAVTLTFPYAGCWPVSVRIFDPATGASATASLRVSVGPDACK